MAQPLLSLHFITNVAKFQRHPVPKISGFPALSAPRHLLHPRCSALVRRHLQLVPKQHEAGSPSSSQCLWSVVVGLAMAMLKPNMEVGKRQNQCAVVRQPNFCRSPLPISKRPRSMSPGHLTQRWSGNGHGIASSALFTSLLPGAIAKANMAPKVGPVSMEKLPFAMLVI